MKRFALGLFVSIGLLLSANSAYAFGNTSLDGTITIEYEDFQNHSQERYWLTDKSDNRTEVLLAHKPHWLTSGQKVRARGKQSNGKFVIEDEGITLLLTSEESSTPVVSSYSSIAPVVGERSVLAVIVDFESAPNENVTEEAIYNLVFNSAASYFDEASYGQMTLVGDIVNNITVSLDPSVCDSYGLSQSADSLLLKQGYAPDSYDHVIYFITNNSGCTWSGKGTVGGTGTGRTWIKVPTLTVLTHELGHNFGLQHAHALECDGETLAADTSSCKSYDYGDFVAKMGNANTASHFSGFNKEYLGWLGTRVTEVTDSNVVTLSAFEESSPAYPQVLKISKGLDSTGSQQWYYLEYRQPIGFDRSLINKTPSLQEGLVLRKATEGNLNSSFLLDSSPLSSWSDITINPGSPYIDTNQGIEINVVAANGAQIDVEVTYSSDQNVGQCTAAPLSFNAISPSESHVGVGESASFSYVVTNNDSDQCEPSVVSIADSSDNGLTATVDINDVTLNPGEHQTIALDVQVADNLTDGAYEVAITASRSVNADSVTQKAKLYVTSGSVSNTPPAAIDDSQPLESKSRVTVAVLSNDFDADGDALRIVSVSQPSKGTVTINSDNTIDYIPSKRFKQSDQFTYTISDGQFESTAQVNVKLSTTSGNDGAGGKGNGKNK